MMYRRPKQRFSINTHPYYSGFVFGDAWGKVSARAHCAAARARKKAKKQKYRWVNVETQIAKFCTEADYIEEQQALIYDTDGAVVYEDTGGGGGVYDTDSGIYDTGNGNGNGNGEEPKSMLTIIIGVAALAIVGGGALLFFTKPKKKK